jgi:hypothetical protein
VPLPDLRGLSDRELGNYVRDTVLRIARLESQIEPAAARRKRTVKIVRSTILMGGGLLAATVVDLLALIIALLGLWDCFEAIEDDVRTMNRQHELRRVLIGLESELDALEAEIERRRPIT